MLVIDLSNFLMTGIAIGTVGIAAASITKILVESKYEDKITALKVEVEYHKADCSNESMIRYRLQDKIRMLEYQIESMEMDIIRERARRFEAPRCRSKRENDLLQKAVKKAMMAAHPDRSGTNATADEFREYKELWEELKGGR